MRHLDIADDEIGAFFLKDRPGLRAVGACGTDETRGWGRDVMANILVVEDDPLVLETLTAALESKGHSVASAPNGIVGLRQFAQSSFDLVISDIIMPDMEGIGMILELRRKNPEVKILAISGGGRTGNGDFLDVAKKLGAMAILQKPIRPAELFHTVDRCLADDTHLL